MWTWNVYDRRKQRKWLKEWRLITIVSAFRMATLKEPPEASYKPPPKSKWSVPPAAPKCPACRKGSDNDRYTKVHKFAKVHQKWLYCLNFFHHRSSIYPAELVMASDRTPFHKACVRCKLCKVHNPETKESFINLDFLSNYFLCFAVLFWLQCEIRKVWLLPL